MTLLDDNIWPQFLQRRIRGTDWPVLASPTRWRSFVLVPFAGLAILLGISQVKEAIAPAQHRASSLAYELQHRPVFASERIRAVSANDRNATRNYDRRAMFGTDWKPYEFRWKPGDLSRPPGFNTPHQPRLDWQMWFEALRLERDPRLISPWFQSFLMRLLKGRTKGFGTVGRESVSGGATEFHSHSTVPVPIYRRRRATANRRVVAAQTSVGGTGLVAKPMSMV